MPDALDLLNNGAAFIDAQFGTTAFVIEGLGSVTRGQWNDLGRTETLEINGKRVTFQVMVEFPRSTFPTTALVDLLKLAGRLVIRSDNGQVFRITGEVAVDETTIRFPLDSRHK